MVAHREGDLEFHVIADFLFDWEYWIAPDGKLRFVSPSCKRITGYSAEEFMSKPKLLTEIIHPDDKPRIAKHFENVNEAEMHTYDFRIVKPNGEVRWIAHACQPVFSDKGEFLGRRTSNRDVTDRKEAEKQTQAWESRFRETLNGLLEGFQIIGRDWRYIYVNEAAAKQGRSTVNQLVGKKMTEVYPGIEKTMMFQKLQKCMDEKTSLVMENEFLFPNGDRGWFELSAQPVAEGLFVLSQDITPRKKAEMELARSERRWAATLSSIGDAVIATDTDAHITFMNQVAEKLTGWKFSEAKQKPLHEVFRIVNEKTRKTVKNPVVKVLEKGLIVGLANHTVLIRKNGDEIPIDDSGAPIHNDSGEISGVVLVFRDISERKKAEEEISNVAKFPAEDPNPVLRITENGTVLYANRASKVFLQNNELSQITQNVQKTIQTGRRRTVEFGYKEKTYLFTFAPFPKEGYVNVYGVDITESKEKDRELVQEKKKLDAITQSLGTGVVVIDKDFRITWINKLASEEQKEFLGKKCYSALHNRKNVCSMCGVKKVFDKGVSIDIHQCCYVVSDERPQWIELIATPVKDEAGNVVSAVEIVLDITEKKDMQAKLEEYSKRLEMLVDTRTKQLEDVQLRLIKSERLAAIGELAGMIGHDLRNPLSGIKNSAYFLKKKGAAIDKKQFSEMIQTIERCIESSNKIINDLLDYSREIHLEINETTPQRLVVKSLAAVDVPTKVKVRNKVTDQYPIKVDEDKLQRVFINLIKNAIDVLPNGGIITLDSTQNNGCIEFRITDNGCGIPREVVPKLFAPLVTTKAQGMGFGLAICKRILEAHGGSITVEKTSKKGTTFLINIPTNANNITQSID
jgi:PAS domain S-box-containing protein